MFERDFKTIEHDHSWGHEEYPTWKGEKVALKNDIQRLLERIETLEEKFKTLANYLEVEYVEPSVSPAKVRKKNEIDSGSISCSAGSGSMSQA